MRLEPSATGSIRCKWGLERISITSRYVCLFVRLQYRQSCTRSAVMSNFSCCFLPGIVSLVRFDCCYPSSGTIPSTHVIFCLSCPLHRHREKRDVALHSTFRPMIRDFHIFHSASRSNKSPLSNNPGLSILTPVFPRGRTTSS